MPNKLNPYWAWLVRLGFHLLYNQLAWTYDLVSWLVSFGEWRAWQQAALPHINGPDVLEIAHGPGHMLLALHEAGCHVIGLDLSPQMGVLSRRRLQKAGASIPLLRARAQNLPLRAQTLDTILVTFPTSFLLLEETLSEIQRVLRADGRLVVVPAARFTSHSVAARFVDWLYVITGQRYDRGLAQEQIAEKANASLWAGLRPRFEAAGFDLAVHHVALKQSEATVLVGQKRTAGA